MAYRMAGLPSIALSDIPTPERIQFKAPIGGIRGEGSWLARSLGLVPSIPVSNEAWGEMTPSEVEAAGTEAGRAGNWNIIKILAAIASMFAPEAYMLASGAEHESEKARGTARETVSGAQARSFAKRMEERLQQTEGLLPTPTSAEEGYMPVGVARGMQAESFRDKTDLARQKIVGKIEGAVAPLIDKKMKGGALSKDEQANLMWGLQVLQSLKPAATGFLGQPMAPQPIPPMPGRGGKTEPTPAGAEAAPLKTGRKATDKRGVVFYEYSDGRWLNDRGEEYK